jgi:hypothetical protein
MREIVHSEFAQLEVVGRVGTDQTLVLGKQLTQKSVWRYQITAGNLINLILRIYNFFVPSVFALEDLVQADGTQNCHHLQLGQVTELQGNRVLVWGKNLLSVHWSISGNDIFLDQNQ